VRRIYAGYHHDFVLLASFAHKSIAQHLGEGISAVWHVALPVGDRPDALLQGQEGHVDFGAFRASGLVCVLVVVAPLAACQVADADFADLRVALLHSDLTNGV